MRIYELNVTGTGAAQPVLDLGGFWATKVHMFAVLGTATAGTVDVEPEIPGSSTLPIGAQYRTPASNQMDVASVTELVLDATVPFNKVRLDMAGLDGTADILVFAYDDTPVGKIEGTINDVVSVVAAP